MTFLPVPPYLTYNLLTQIKATLCYDPAGVESLMNCPHSLLVV